jgi:DNA polymerase-1
VYEDLSRFTPKLREGLAAHKDQVFRSREMSRIITDLPVTLDVEATRFRDYDRAGVLELFRDLEFRSLIPRLPPADGNLAPVAAPAARPGQLSLGLDPAPTVAPPVATTLVGPEDAAGVASRLRAAPSVAVHADVDVGRHPMLLGLGLAAGDDAWYVPTISGVPAPDRRRPCRRDDPEGRARCEDGAPCSASRRC